MTEEQQAHKEPNTLYSTPDSPTIKPRTLCKLYTNKQRMKYFKKIYDRPNVYGLLRCGRRIVIHRDKLSFADKPNTLSWKQGLIRRSLLQALYFFTRMSNRNASSIEDRKSRNERNSTPSNTMCSPSPLRPTLEQRSLKNLHTRSNERN